MKISVVIPVKNNADLLFKLIKNLLSQTLKPHEIIVVDDGSTNGSPEIAKECGAKVLFTNGSKGPNFARSLGVRNSVGDIIAFIDSDCVPSKDWIESLVKDFQEHPEVSIVAGTTVAANPDNFLARFLDCSLLTPTPKYKDYLLLKGDFNIGTIVATCNMAILKHVFEKVGLFDPEYKHYGSDDMDFVYRALRKGFIVLCSPRPLVRHYHRTTLSKVVKRYFQYGQGFAIFLKKHPRSTFSISIVLMMTLLIGLLTLSLLIAFINPTASILTLLLILLPLLIHHTHKILKEKRVEVLLYPLLDLILIIASIVGFLYMLLRKSPKSSPI